MPRSASSLDQLFDRSWRPGHPFCPRLSAARRWGMLCVLCFLVAVIAAYVYLTDSNRVRRMCESYLSQLSGGQVTVKHAALSIFEGLRLDGVSVRVDNTSAKDSPLFDAQTVLIKYNPESILNGKLEATQIIAIDPRVRLCEDVDAKKWNYERMKLPTQPTTSQSPRSIPTLPEISLRNGIIDYSQIQNGQITSLKSMSVDAALTPLDRTGWYHFGLQSRGASDGIGPAASGQFNPTTGEVEANGDAKFGSDIRGMMPDKLGRWLEQHRLAGLVKVPRFYMKRGEKGKDPTFRIEMVLEDVALSIQPGEWLGAAESDRYATLQGAFDLMRAAGLNGHPPGAFAPPRPGKPTPTDPPNASWRPGFVDRIESFVAPTPVQLDVSRGVFVFTDQGIDFQQVKGAIEQNKFILNGHIAGYSPSSPAEITMEGRDIQIPDNPRYVNSMPREVREFYEHMHPSGRGSLWVKLIRPQRGGRPELAGELNIDEGHFKLDQFPYPLRKLRGKISFGPDRDTETRLDINLSGLGATGGPNENKTLSIKGWIAPLSPDGEMRIRASAEDISSEPLVRASLPPEAREALDHLDPSGKGDYPEFRGNLSVDLDRVPGPNKPLHATIVLDLKDGKGAYDVFPYMLDHVTGRLVVGPGYVRIEQARGRHGGSTLGIDGTIAFGRNKPITPTIHLDAHDVDVDADLLAALNPDSRKWVERLGVGGKVDFTGDVFRTVPPATQPGSVPPPRRPEIDVTLDIALKNGTLRPQGSQFTLTDVNGKIRSAEGKLLLTGFTARRDAAQLTGEGTVIPAGDDTRLALSIDATNLTLDPPLYQLLPDDGKAAWDSLKPDGTLDVSLKYNTRPPTTGPATMPVATIDGAVLPPSPVVPQVDLTLRPRKLDATFKGVPYRLRGVSGTITLRDDQITLTDIAAKHGAADIALSGTGSTGGRAVWDISLHGRNLPADAELKQALPPALAHLLDSMKATGKFSFDFTKIHYAAGPPSASPATGPVGSPRPAAGEPDIDLAGNLWLIDTGLDVGVPLTELQGMVTLDAHLVNGRLAGLTGTADATTFKIGDRPAGNLHLELFKPAGQDAMRIDKMRCTVAGGEMAGQIDVAFPETAASRFAMTLVLRNADVRQLAGEKENIKGQLTASLSLEGAWGDTATRRGRGDVTVSGRDMYHIPLVLGLLQVTNLSLPISSPFSEANARYLVDGQKVTFESIEMRASNMVMQGSGSMDFGTKRVRMTFTTDNPNWPKLPFVNELIQGAKHELLQIQVSGTVQEPKVKGSMFNTFSTTVDEVFRAGSGPKIADPSTRRQRTKSQ